MRCPSCHRRLLPGAACDRHATEVALAEDTTALETTAVEAVGPSEGGFEARGFEMVRVLGRGGFATVYLARRLANGGLTAIKLAHARGDERLCREGMWLGRIGPPIAPALWDQGQTADGRPFLVMEFLGDDSLAQRLAARPHAHASAAEIMPVFLSLCRAVAVLHEAGIVHRDLKPENLLFRGSGEVAVIDYGLATVACEDAPVVELATLTREDETLGTPMYMAPEQWTMEAVDARTDIYALGVILFELLTGRPPFVGPATTVRHGHVLGRCPAPSSFAAVSAAVDEVVLRCLVKEPARRFGSASELADALAGAVAATSRPAGPAQAALATAAEARPTVMLALDTARDTPQVMELGRLHDAVLALREGTTHILVWPWASSLARGMQSAVRLAAAAAESLDVSGPAVVHVDVLTIRQRGARMRVLGAALADAGWRQVPGGVNGVVLSREAARHAGEGATVIEQGFARPGAAPVLLPIDPASLPLRGRDALLEELLEAVKTCVQGRQPLLATLVGDVGMGKTRALDALTRALRPVEGARVFYLRARQEAPGALVAALARIALGLAPGGTGAVDLAALERAWAEAGGAADAAGVWALAYHLGMATAETSGVARVLAAPGALRQATASALARLLGHAAASASLVLLVDDAHWADHAALDALELGTMPEPGIVSESELETSVESAARGGLDGEVGREDGNAAGHESGGGTGHGNGDRAGQKDGDGDGHVDGSGAGARAGGCLAVVAAARASFASLRPRWGDRAARAASQTLAPLDDTAARALVGDLLRPVEFVPQPVVDRLHALAGGVPLYLVEIGRTLRESGAIRQRPGMHGYYLAADELLHAADTPVFARLAERLVGSVPAPLLPVLELCALLDEGFAAVDVHGIQRALEAQSGAGAADAAVALARLEEMGVLAPAGAGHAFRHPLLARAVAALIPGARKRAWHAAALHYYEQHQERGTALGRARHAAAAGATGTAARLRLALGDEAHAQHRYVDAEEHYSAALELLAPDDAARVQALAGRGSVRYRLQRFHDALADLRSARALVEAGAEPDEARVLTLLLEEATVLDWCQEWGASAALAERAWPLAERLGSAQPALAAGAELAVGRACYRREELDAAIVHLSVAVDRAVAAGAQEVQIIATLLLATALAYASRADESEACFAQVIELCLRAGDDFHRAAAHINRQILWMKREQVDRAVADLEVCITLGQELGHAQIERGSTFNLAELLHWSGQPERALTLARRARALQLRFFREHRFHDDALLLARILCPGGNAEVREHLTWIEEHCDLAQMVPSARVLLDLVRLALAEHERGCFTPAAWADLAGRAAQHALLEERVEVLVCAAEVALGLGARGEAASWLGMASEVAAGSRLWAPTLARLGQRIMLPESQHREAG